MAAGKVVIVIELVADTCAHPVDAAIVFVTVYVPAVLADKSTCPVAALINTILAGAENVPATPPPLNVGVGSVPFEQYGVHSWTKRKLPDMRVWQLKVLRPDWFDEIKRF